MNHLENAIWWNLSVFRGTRNYLGWLIAWPWYNLHVVGRMGLLDQRLSSLDTSNYLGLILHLIYLALYHKISLVHVVTLAVWNDYWLYIPLILVPAMVEICWLNIYVTVRWEWLRRIYWPTLVHLRRRKSNTSSLLIYNWLLLNINNLYLFSLL